MLPTRLAVLVCYIMWSNISDDSYQLTSVDVALTVVAASHSHSSCSTVTIVLLLTVTGSDLKLKGHISTLTQCSLFSLILERAAFLCSLPVPGPM